MRARLWAEDSDRYLEGWSADLSRGGVFVESSAPLPVATSLRFQLEGPEGQQPIEGLGQVAWTRDRAISSRRMAAGMGIQFIALSDEGLRAFERLHVSPRPQRSAQPARTATAPPRRRSKSRRARRRARAKRTGSFATAVLAVLLVGMTTGLLALSSDRYPLQQPELRTSTVQASESKWNEAAKPVKAALERATRRARKLWPAATGVDGEAPALLEVSDTPPAAPRKRK